MKTPNSALHTPHCFMRRFVSLLVVESFLLTSILPAFGEARPPAPLARRPAWALESSHLRPTDARDGGVGKDIRRDLQSHSNESGGFLTALRNPALRQFITTRMEAYFRPTAFPINSVPKIIETLSQFIDSPGLAYQAIRERFPELFDPSSSFRKEFHRGESARVRDLAEWLQPHVKGPIVVDIGAGDTRMIEALLELEPTIEVGYATDIRPSPRESQHPRAKFILQDSPISLPIEFKSVDTVVLSRVLHHIDPLERYILLGNIRAILKPGGRLLLVENTFPAAPLRYSESDSLMNSFSKFTKDEKLQILFFTDWWGNHVMKETTEISIPHTFGTAEDWQGLFENGFNLKMTSLEYAGIEKQSPYIIPPTALLVFEHTAHSDPGLGELARATDGGAKALARPVEERPEAARASYAPEPERDKGASAAKDGARRFRLTKLPPDFSEWYGTAWDARLRRDLETIPEERSNDRSIKFDPVTGVKARREGSYLLRFDPRRAAGTTLASTAPRDVRVYRSLAEDRERFNFTKTPSDYNLGLLELPDGTLYRLLSNKSPLFRGHGLVVSERLREQVITEADIWTAIQLARRTGMTVYYNGLGAGASVNHFHLHLVPESFPIHDLLEIGGIQNFSSPQGSLRGVWQGFVPTHHQKHAAPHLVFRTNDRDASGRIYQWSKYLFDNRIPQDIVFRGDQAVVFGLSNDPYTNVVDLFGTLEPSAVEYGQILTFYDEKIFNTITAVQIDEGLKRMAQPEQNFESRLQTFLANVSHDGGQRALASRPDEERLEAVRDGSDRNDRFDRTLEVVSRLGERIASDTENRLEKGIRISRLMRYITNRGELTRSPSEKDFLEFKKHATPLLEPEMSEFISEYELKESDRDNILQFLLMGFSNSAMRHPFYTGARRLVDLLSEEDQKKLALFFFDFDIDEWPHIDPDVSWSLLNVRDPEAERRLNQLKVLAEEHLANLSQQDRERAVVATLEILVDRARREFGGPISTADGGTRLTARDGGGKFIGKKDIKNITFRRKGRFAEGRAISLDLSEVDLTLAYSEEVRRTDFFGRMPPVGFPLRQWVDALKDRSPLVAINGPQTDLRGPSGFFIVKGKLIQKPTGARGIRQAVYTPLNGQFSVFVLDGKPRVEKVSIQGNTLLTKGIQFALSGPPLLIDGEDVSSAIHERNEGSSLPVQDAEVAWDPEKITASFSAIGVKEDGRIVLLSMVGDSNRQKEMYVWEVAEVLKGLGVTDAILLGGSGDTQQYLEGDLKPFLLAKGRQGSMRPEAGRPLGTAILVYPRSGERGQLDVLKIESSTTHFQNHFRQEKERLLEQYKGSSEGLSFADAYASLLIQTVRNISEIRLQGLSGIAVMVGGSVALRGVSALSDLDLFIVRNQSIDPGIFKSAKNKIIEDLKIAGIEMDMTFVDTIEELVNVVDLGNVVYINEAKEAVLITGDEAVFRRFKEVTEERTRKSELIASDFTYHLLHRTHTFQVYNDPHSPNVKYSPGGKRALFDIYRILTRIYGIDALSIQDVFNRAVERKTISPQEKDEILNAYNFFISLENEISRLGREDSVLKEAILQRVTEITGNIKGIWDRVTEAAFQELKRQRSNTWARQMDEIRSLDLPASRRRELFLSAEDDGIRYAVLRETHDTDLLREASQEKRWLLLVAVASNVHTPTDVLNRLGQTMVRGFEDVTLFVARNPSTLPVTLQQILDNPDMSSAIQSAAKANLQRRGEKPKAAGDGGGKTDQRPKTKDQTFTLARDGGFDKTAYEIVHETTRPLRRLITQMDQALSEVPAEDEERFTSEVRAQLKHISKRIMAEVIRLGQPPKIRTIFPTRGQSGRFTPPATAYSELRKGAKEFILNIDAFTTARVATVVQRTHAGGVLGELTQKVERLEEDLIVRHLVKIIREEIKRKPKLDIGDEAMLERRIGLPPDFDRPAALPDPRGERLVEAALTAAGYDVVSDEWTLVADDSEKTARDGGEKAKPEIVEAIVEELRGRGISSLELNTYLSLLESGGELYGMDRILSGIVETAFSDHRVSVNREKLLAAVQAARDLRGTREPREFQRIGQNRKAEIFEVEIGDEAWIRTGNSNFHVWIVGEEWHFQQFDKRQTGPVSPHRTFAFGKTLEVERGHFAVTIDKSNGKVTLMVVDRGQSLEGTGILFNKPTRARDGGEEIDQRPKTKDQTFSSARDGNGHQFDAVVRTVLERLWSKADNNDQIVRFIEEVTEGSSAPNHRLVLTVIDVFRENGNFPIARLDEVLLAIKKELTTARDGGEEIDYRPETIDQRPKAVRDGGRREAEERMKARPFIRELTLPTVYSYP